MFKDGTTYRAECNVSGGSDFSGADASTVIQAAIDIIEAAGGGIVLVKEGLYEISTSVDVKNKVILYGEGQGTIFKWTGASGGNAVIYCNVNSLGVADENVAIENLYVDCNLTKDQGIVIRNCNNGHIRNCVVRNFKNVDDVAIGVGFCKGYGTIVGCDVADGNVSGPGTSATAGIYITGSGTEGIQISLNRVHDTPTRGIYVEDHANYVDISDNLLWNITGAGGAINFGEENVNAANNIIWNCKRGISLEGDSDSNVLRFTVSNNQIYVASNGDHGILINTYCKHGTVTGNQIYYPRETGIEIGSNCDHITLTGNEIYGGLKRGIYLTTNSTKYITIVGNNVTNNTEYGIVIASGADYIILVANDFTGNTIGGILDLGMTNSINQHNLT